MGLVAGNDQVIFTALTAAFRRLEANFWAVKTQNLWALFQRTSAAIKIWESILDESISVCGSLFRHPAWMVFINLQSRLRKPGDTIRRRELFSKAVRELARTPDYLQVADKAGFVSYCYDKLRAGEDVMEFADEDDTSHSSSDAETEASNDC